mgnify:CR=1 FL=1
MRSLRFVLSISAILALGMFPAGAGGEPFIVVASTTSTQNSGLFDHLLPRFLSETGIAVRIVEEAAAELKKVKGGDEFSILLEDLESTGALGSNTCDDVKICNKRGEPDI